MLNRMYGFHFPVKGVGTLEGAKFTTNQWWASNGNFGTSRASTANAIWARLETLRPLVDPITGDITAAERSARLESRSALTNQLADRRVRETAARSEVHTDTPADPALREQWRLNTIASLERVSDASTQGTSASTSFGGSTELGRGSTSAQVSEGVGAVLGGGNEDAVSSPGILGAGGLGTRPASHFGVSTAAPSRLPLSSGNDDAFSSSGILGLGGLGTRPALHFDASTAAVPRSPFSASTRTEANPPSQFGATTASAASTKRTAAMAFQDEDVLFEYARADTRVFRGAESEEELHQCRAEFAISRDHRLETCLVTRGGWKALVNWRLTKETGYGVRLEDLHFDTAVVRELVDNPRLQFAQFDSDGTSEIARKEGRQVMAEEFLDGLWMTLVGRLTSGALATCFSPRLLNILAGTTAEPPQPDLVAALFQQLVAAGNKVQGKLPYGNNQSKAASGVGAKSIVKLPESERRDRRDRQQKAAAEGTPDRVLDLVATAIAGSAGTTFPEKHASYRKSSSQSLSANKSLASFGESDDGTGITIKTTDSTSTFHMSMQIECVYHCLETRGNAEHMRTNLDEVKATYQAVTSRKFSSPKFKILNLLPSIPRPADAVLLKGLKEVNDGLWDNSADAYQTAAEDQVVYPWLRLALLGLEVVDGPNFDPAFLECLNKFTSGIQRWSVAGVPLSQVSRAVTKFFMCAERESDQRSAMAGRGYLVPSEGGFRGGADIGTEIAALDRYSRSDERSASLQWRRQAELYGVAPFPKTTAGAPTKTDRNMQTLVDRAVSARLKQSRQNGHAEDRNVPSSNKKKRKRKPRKGRGRSSAKNDSESEPSDDEKPSSRADSDGSKWTKRGTGTQPAKRESSAGKSTRQLANRMDRTTWQRKFGTTTVDGDETKLCWFHLHQEGGCTLPDGKECIRDHGFPDEYGGKLFSELSRKEQERISDASLKPR